MSKVYIWDLEIQSEKASHKKKNLQKTGSLETRVSVNSAKEWKISRDGESLTSYTSQNPWTIVGSSGKNPD